MFLRALSIGIYVLLSCSYYILIRSPSDIYSSFYIFLKVAISQFSVAIACLQYELGSYFSVILGVSSLFSSFPASGQYLKPYVN